MKTMQNKISQSKPLAYKIKFWLPVVIWAVVIFLFSAHPTKQASQIFWQDFITKKTAHIVEYAIFATLVYRALKSEGMEYKKAGYTAIFISFLYGVSDEFHQSFTPGREPTVRDVIFDTIGSITAILIIWNILPKAPKTPKVWAKKLQLI